MEHCPFSANMVVKFMGCSVDVLDILDAACSGRNQCEVPVTDKRLEQVNPCNKMLRTFLEASYSCIQGTFETFKEG